jgi:2-oxoisovalerate dehydrogenase E2 component (dihydrolipoyl transacylase)
MTTQVLMPQFGESVVEGTITRWLKQPGEFVEEYEPLIEVNTDKVDTEIPSPASGKLVEILVKEGTVAYAGQVLAVIEEGFTPLERKVEYQVPAQLNQVIPAQTNPIRPGRDPELGFISPVVAKLAQEEQIDLHKVKGSGKNGRITKQDVLDHLNVNETHEKVKEILPVAIPKFHGTAGKPPADDQVDLLLPLNPVRRAIAERMVFSKHTSPHVTTVMEVDLSQIATHRQANQELFSRDGVKLTYTAYFISATIMALKAFPLVNSSWSDTGLVLHKSISIGIATSLGEGGLIVPVIKHADTLSLLGLARAVNDLANRARLKQLKPEEVKDGTFTITNHGISGSLFATPIINQPQCGILGIGLIQKRVTVIEDSTGNDAIAIRPMAYLSFSFDHRILDGVVADNFLVKVVESLRNFT